MKYSQIVNSKISRWAAPLVLALTTSVCAAADTGATNSPAAAQTASAPVVTVKEYLKDPAQFAGRQIVLQGFVTDVCKRKGCWALLHDADSEAKGEVRVKQDEEGQTFKAFLPELQGRTIQVTGDVNETKIDNAYLDKWETNVKAAKERAEKAKTAGEKNEAGQGFDNTLKQIAEYRERVAKAKHGYLSSYSVAVTQWRESEARN